MNCISTIICLLFFQVIKCPNYKHISLASPFYFKMVIYLYINCENISHVTLNMKVTGVNLTEIYKSMVK